MTFGTLLRRSLTHYWRTNLAVIAGVGVAVSVLAGALLVGTSVRGSLRDLALLRLGQVDHVVTSGLFFREALADELLASGALGEAATVAVPLIAVEGFATHQESRTRAGGIQVYAVDERFWAFHGLDAEGRVPEAGGVAVSSGLARELGVAVDDILLLRVQKPSSIPVSSLHGRRDDLGRTLRQRVEAVLSSDELGEFSFRPQQGLSRAVFVQLGRMQRELDIGGQANTLLLGTNGAAEVTDTAAAVATIETALRSETLLEDLGVRVRALEGRGQLVVESAAGLLSDDTVVAARAAAAEAGLADQPILTYLANQIRLGDRVTPYSLVTAFDLETLGLDDAALGGVPTGPQSC